MEDIKKKILFLRLALALEHIILLDFSAASLYCITFLQPYAFLCFY